MALAWLLLGICVQNSMVVSYQDRSEYEAQAEDQQRNDCQRYNTDITLCHAIRTSKYIIGNPNHILSKGQQSLDSVCRKGKTFLLVPVT